MTPMNARSLGCFLLAIWVGTFPLQAWAQKQAGQAGMAAQQPSRPPAAPVPRSDQGHPLAVNLATIGALACVERANQVAMFIDPRVSSQTIVHTPENNPNQRLLMATMVIESEKNGYTLGNVALAPGQANGCGGSYHTVSYVDMPCAKAAEKNFPDLKFNKLNQLEVGIAIVGKNMWIIAMPAGNGCVFEKEEVVR